MKTKRNPTKYAYSLFVDGTQASDAFSFRREEARENKRMKELTMKDKTVQIRRLPLASVPMEHWEHIR